MFELVPNPERTRQPMQRFAVQIKGDKPQPLFRGRHFEIPAEKLSFPCVRGAGNHIRSQHSVFSDGPSEAAPGADILEIYLPRFLASIDFSNNSATINFTAEDELEDSPEGMDRFIKKLSHIADTHSYVKQLEPREYEKEDVIKLITARCESISEAIQTGTLLHDTRDRISRKILTELEDLCEGTLLLNGLRYYGSVSLRTAWELALLDIKTKFLATFLQGLRYIGLRVPEEGQYERLMLKYYGFLWKIRAYLREFHGLALLNNLEKIPRESTMKTSSTTGFWQRPSSLRPIPGTA